MSKQKVSELLEKIIEIADLKKDKSLRKWVYLELEGYYQSNKYLSKKDIVPQYREVVGEHRDIYGRPLIISDPELYFVNITRLRHSVPELESLAKKNYKLLSIKDLDTCKIIKEHLKVTVSELVFNPASIDGILNSIKQEAFRRAEKYVSRRELMSVEVKNKTQEIGITQDISIPFHFLNSFWNILHPEIVKPSKSRFEANHLADSVEATFKEVNNTVKLIVKDKTGKEFDGADLMNRAFSLHNPIIILGDLSTKTGKDIQKGYMQIFSGAMTGIRNPKAHANIIIDKPRAIHFLFLASLLMFKIDEGNKDTTIK